MPLRRSERIRAMRGAVRAAAAAPLRPAPLRPAPLRPAPLRAAPSAAQDVAIAPRQRRRRRGPRSRPSGGTPHVAVAQEEIAGQDQRPPLPPSVENTRNTTAGRLSRELANIMENPVEGCHVEILHDDINHWMAYILGPIDTPYEGGQFQLYIEFPEKYPHIPPRVLFLTKIYHCNILREGYICLDILAEKWSPVLTVEKILLSIRSLLADPNPKDPLELEIAELYINNREKHDRNARDWTARYAKSS